MVAMLEGLDVDAIGMNCSLGPAQMLDILDDFLSLSSLPIIVTPNAGLPKSVNGAPVYDVSSQDFALEMKKICPERSACAGRLLRNNSRIYA